MRDINAGREMVARGDYRPPSMVASMNIIAYLDQQRERVATRGQCEGGCDRTDLIEHYATARIVCPRTLQPCQSRRLAAIVQTYQRINNRDNDSTE
jgi:hypothetical protein